MNRLIPVMFVLALASTLAQAQLYVKAGAGYQLSLGGIQIDRDRVESPSNVDSYTYKYGSYGAGFEVAGALGYSLTSSVAAELGVVMNLGPSYETKEIRQNTAQNSTTTYEGSMLAFSPALIVSGQLGGLKPYARIGIVLGFPSQVITESRPTNQVVNTYSGGQFFGFQGALGTTFSAGGSFTMYVELSMLGGSWSPTKLEEKDGAVTTAFTLKDSYADTETFTLSQPSVPFGSVGLRAGLMFGL